MFVLKKLAQMAVAISAGVLLGGIAGLAGSAVFGPVGGYIAFVLVGGYATTTAGSEMGL